MSKYVINDSTLTGIADAVRTDRLEKDIWNEVIYQAEVETEDIPNLSYLYPQDIGTIFFPIEAIGNTIQVEVIDYYNYTTTVATNIDDYYGIKSDGTIEKIQIWACSQNTNRWTDVSQYIGLFSHAISTNGGYNITKREFHVKISNLNDGDVCNRRTPSELTSAILSRNNELLRKMCNRCGSITLPDDIWYLGQNTFYGANFSEINLPKNLIYIGSHCFASNLRLTSLVIPATVTTIDGYMLDNSSRVKQVTFLGPYYSTFNSNIFSSSSVSVVYVHTSYYDDYKSHFTKTIKALHDTDLSNLIITGANTYNILHPKTSAQMEITYNDLDNAYDDQRGVTWSCSSNASIDENGVVTFNGTYAEGDTITVTATSTYDTSIVETFAINCVSIDTQYTVDTTQWQVSSETVESGDTVYESFSNYHVDNGIAKTSIHVIGYSQFVVYIRSYGENGYDYTIISNPNITEWTTSWSSSAAGWTGVQANTKTSSSATTYLKVEYTDLTGDDYIYVWYGKDSSSNSGTDKGYFYVAESECG